MTTQSTTTEPTLEELAIEAARFLESMPDIIIGKTKREAQQLAFALRSRVSAPIVAPVADDKLIERVVDAVYRSMSRYDSGEWWLDTLRAKARVKKLLAAPASAVAPQQSRTPLDDIEAALISIADGVSPQVAVGQAFAIINSERARFKAAPASPTAPRGEAEPTQELLELARKVYVEVSGDDEGMQDIQTTAQACQVINGFLREVRTRCRESVTATTPPSTLAKAAAQEIANRFNETDAAPWIERIIIERCFSAGDEDK